MQLVSKKDVIFITCIFLFVIVFSLLTGGESVEVGFGDESMSIESTNFEFTVAYADVAGLELTMLPELGTMDKGYDTSSLKNGNWSNAIWGDYHLCVIPEVPNCVVVTLNDGRRVVFNYKGEENTADVYEIFQNQLASYQAEN